LGYASAVLSRISKKVIAIEKVHSLVKVARKNIESLGIKNIEIREGDGSSGLADEAPFDIIVISTPTIKNKKVFLKQLSSRGQLICIEYGEESLMTLVKYFRDVTNKFRRIEYGVLKSSHGNDEILIELGLISNDVLQQAREEAKKNKSLVIDEVRKLMSVNDIELYRSLAQQHGLNLGKVDELLSIIDPMLFDSCSKGFLDHHRIIPLCIQDDTLIVATNNPDASMTEIQKVFPQLSIEKILVTPTDFLRIWKAIDLSLKTDKQLETELLNEASNQLQESFSKPKQEAHLVSLFEALLLDAVAERASDIHLEIYGRNVRVRLRVDGELKDLPHYFINRREMMGLINVIKIRSELNIAERRLPQGGRSRLTVGDAKFDLRVQIQPSLHGEHVIIRLLPQNPKLISIEQLGMSTEIADNYKRMLRNPAGLMLVVGPTGSGKSTTLYAGLQLLAADSTRKVITVEDPIEYSIDRIQQTRVRPDIGFNFDDAMRSFVREDPDVILVGEIRDHETAIEAVRASQTGHVLLSTLHSNDAIDAIQRLFDLGIHPNSLASELLAIMAQRLAKKICENCRVETEPNKSILQEIFPAGTPDSFVAYSGKGCRLCQQTGTKGRVAVVEYFQITPDIRNAISKQLPVAELRKLALDCGLVTMRDSALDHVINGNISLSELPRILPAERMAPEARWQLEQ